MDFDTFSSRQSDPNSDVQELRFQLRQLTEELQNLRTNLTSTDPSIRQSFSSLTSGLASPQSEQGLRPPLPPRRYRPMPQPPAKPIRTFEHSTLSLSSSAVYRHPPPLPPKARRSSEGVFTAHPVLSNDSSKTPSPRGTQSPVSEPQANLASLLREPLNENSILKQLEDGFLNKAICWYDLGPLRLFVNQFNNLLHNASRHIPQPVCALAHELYTSLHESDTSQSVVFSGESGSGKSYLSLQLLKQLFRTFGGSDSFNVLSAATSVLRSFGCVKTEANGRASRIGFLYEIHIADGVPAKTKLNCLFTDLDRIVTRRSGSFNFDIFHEMMTGLTNEEKAKFHLDGFDHSNLAYLGASRSELSCEERRFSQWRWALNSLGIPFSDVVRIIAAVLLLGNVHFEQCTETNELEITGQTELESVAALLGLSGLCLYKALTRRSKIVKGQNVKATVSAQNVNWSRDALARTLYYRCALAIIRRINSMQAPTGGRPNNNSSGLSSSDGESSVQDSGIGMGGARNFSPGSSQSDGLISILDLFGFNFQQPSSSFEDLCVNLTSERLRLFYQNRIFGRTQKIMMDEGITSYEIEFQPDEVILDAFMLPQSGLLCLLDEQCLESCEDYSKFTQNLKQNLKRPDLIELKDDKSFLVHHYGNRGVKYDCSSFLQINRNDLSPELVSVFNRNQCNFGFASYLFASDVDRASNVPRVICANAGENSAMSTFSQDFMHQLDAVFNTINNSRVHFVHCIRPNEKQEFQMFDRETVKRQIERLDLVSLAHWVCAGLPYCLTFEEFNNRYRFLMSRYNKQHLDLDSKSSEETKVILDCYLRAVDDSNLPYVSNQWALGSQHILLSQGAFAQLQMLKVAPTTQIREIRSPEIRPPISRPTSLLPSMEVNCSPPALPPPRQYAVINGRKTYFPQRRVMVEHFKDGMCNVDLRPGDIVTVRGFAGRNTHLLIEGGNGRTVAVPALSTRLCMR